MNKCKIIFRADGSAKTGLGHLYRLFAIVEMVKYSYPIQRSFCADNGKVEMVWPEYINSRSQDLENRFHDAGQFYWFNVQTYKQKKNVY